MASGRTITRALAGVVFIAAGASAACAPRTRTAHIVESHGVVGCPPDAADALLSVDALQCWFAARHGQWRTLSHDSHYDVLVVQIEAYELRDAEEIAARFVASQRQTFSEIMIYAHAPSPPGSGSTRIRRVRWTRERGTDTFDFVGRATAE